MTRRLIAAILFVVLALICAGFVRLNNGTLTVEYFFSTSNTTAGRALVVAFVSGWLIGIAGALAWARRLARERASLAQALKLAEGEVRTLRATQPAHAR